MLNQYVDVSSLIHEFAAAKAQKRLLWIFNYISVIKNKKQNINTCFCRSTSFKPGSHKRHKHKDKINTKTKHLSMISPLGLAKIKQDFLCFVFCSALGLCLHYDFMLMIMSILMSQVWLHSFVLPFVLSLCLCLCPRVNRRLVVWCRGREGQGGAFNKVYPGRITTCVRLWWVVSRGMEKLEWEAMCGIIKLRFLSLSIDFPDPINPVS